MGRTTFSGLVVLTLTLASCMSRREPFTPSEHATAVTPKGQVAAEYEVIAHGRIAGETKVWSRGAFEEDTADDTDRTLIHVAFVLESTDESPLELELENVALERVKVGDSTFSVTKPTHVEGSTVSEGGGESEVHLFFEVPAGIRPQELDSFRVRWSVMSEGERYEQRTPFLELEKTYPEVYYPYPYYDRYYYRSWFGGPWPY